MGRAVKMRGIKALLYKSATGIKNRVIEALRKPSGILGLIIKIALPFLDSTEKVV